jgi:hypothetical protein
MSPGANPKTITHALSIRQPWAALVVAGLKTVEVRTWNTRRRGPLWIHAGNIPDDRPEAWDWITTPELQALAAQTGGLIGTAELVDCITYADPRAFLVDVPRHRNDPSWFQSPQLYGFVFAAAHIEPYRAFTGNTFFFPVIEQET